MVGTNQNIIYLLQLVPILLKNDPVMSVSKYVGHSKGVLEYSTVERGVSGLHYNCKH